MAAQKKSFFEDLNPALAIIDTTGATTKPDENGEQQRFVYATPERETKSRRVPLLLKPSLYNSIKEEADKAGASVNDYIRAVLEYHLQEKAK